jgi:hypothetical protein
MSSASVLNTIFSYDLPDVGIREHAEDKNCDRALGNLQRFGREQIRSLVHQVFFPGGAKAPRQVVFSSVDANNNLGEICLSVGRRLCTQTSGSVCIVDLASRHPEIAPTLEIRDVVDRIETFDCLRDSALPLSNKLWIVHSDVFLGNEKRLSARWLRTRIDELRLDFDYTIFQAPPAGQCSDAHILGHLCDGIVLVLNANSTRRVAAKKVKDCLSAANARLLGTVLSERQFPIPEALYRRL